MIGANAGPLVNWLAGIDAVLAFILGVLGALVWVMWRELFGVTEHPRRESRDNPRPPSAGAPDSEA